MAELSTENINFKKSTIDTLLGSLSHDHHERLKAEDQIKILETSDDFGVVLTDVIIETTLPTEVRQLSSVILKQYIESHWSALAEEKFRPPEVQPNVKEIIRQNLPKGLQDDNSKIRSSVAYAMSQIASFDWPNEWPELFTCLIQALQSMNPNVIHGAMRVFSEFAGELSDMQIPQVAPVIFPEMLKIFTQPEIYGVRTSARAATIFATLAGLIGLMKEVYKGAEKEHLQPYLPTFIASCSQQLAAPDSPTCDCGLKMEILKALEVLVKNFPKTLLGSISSILPPVWHTFTQSADQYIKTTVNCIDVSADPVDEDGEILSFENMVFSVFEFISALVETPKFKKTVEQHLEEILFYTMVYMQITDEQIHLWSHDPNQFVEDEDEETLSYSVRISAQYLLLTLAERFKSAPKKICTAVHRLKQQGDEARVKGDQNWWKYHEVCLLALGYIQTAIEEKMNDGSLPVDFKDFLINFIISQCEGSHFLVGQSFWCASRYAELLDEVTLTKVLQNTVNSLQENQSPVLKVFAVKSLYGFCDFLKSVERQNVLLPLLEQIAGGLVAISTQFSDSVLAITLETLSIVVKVNEEFTKRLVEEGNLVPLMNALFLKYSSDHHLNPIIEEIITDLVSIPTCFQVILEKTVPTLLSILEAPGEKMPPTIVPPSLDIITQIVRKSPKPLNSTFFKASFPLVVKKVMDSDDVAVLQNGGECLRAYTACAIEQICDWCDSNGDNGLSYVVQCTCKLLDPRTAQSSATLVGKLVNTLVLKAGNVLGDNFSIILRSVLSKLQHSQHFIVIQSLLMVFIQLLRSQLDATLEFLSAVPGPTGNLALEYVLSEWCSKQADFNGNYEIKVSCDALCKVLLHIVNTNDPCFEGIVVDGDPINNNHTRVTRSQAKVTEYTQLPVAVKLFKLLVRELSQIESANENEVESDEEDEEGEEWGDMEPAITKDMTVQQVLDAMFAPSTAFAGFDAVDYEEEDDPDTLADPINQTDLKMVLAHFLGEFTQQPMFELYAPHLNEAEKHTLMNIEKLLTPSTS